MSHEAVGLDESLAANLSGHFVQVPTMIGTQADYFFSAFPRRTDKLVSLEEDLFSTLEGRELQLKEESCF